MLSTTRFRLGTALFCIVLLATSGCERGRALDKAVPAPGAAVEGAVVSGQPGQHAPNFTLERLAGGTLSLDQLRGKAVLLDFWDTWCGPCRIALPHLQALSVEYPDDLAVVGVAMAQEGEQKVRQYVANNKLTFDMLLYARESTLVQNLGGMRGIPTTFLIDADGVIRKKWVGAQPKAVYEKAVISVISAGKAADKNRKKHP